MKLYYRHTAGVFGSPYYRPRSGRNGIKTLDRAGVAAVVLGHAFGTYSGVLLYSYSEKHGKCCFKTAKIVFCLSNKHHGKLIVQSRALSGEVSEKFKRSLYDEIEWNEQLIGIVGGRGTGKTTLLLQRMNQLDLPGKHSVYLSLDDIYFTENKLTDKSKPLKTQSPVKIIRKLPPPLPQTNSKHTLDHRLVTN